MISHKSALLFFLLACNSSAKERQENVQDLINKGVDLVEKNKFEEGIALYSQTVKQNSKVQLAYLNRGLAYFEIKEYAKALADFDKVIQLKSNVVMMVDNDLNPSAEGQLQVDYCDAYYGRALVKSYMDSLQSSFIDFQKAINNGYSDSTNCLVWQGVLFRRDGKNEKACEYFEKAKKAAQTTSQQNEAIDMINKYCRGTKNNL
jgi:tetratricopeptide (TPR) repeat protein